MTRVDGSHMDHPQHNIDIKTYEDEATRLARVSEIYDEIHRSGEYSSSQPEVFRTPGTFLLEFATGLLSEKQILAMVTSHPEAVCSSECMDERVKHAHKGSRHVLSSHDGCGAAGVVAGLIIPESPTYNQQSYDALEGFLGADALKALIAQLQSGASTDVVGRVWSQTLVEKVNAYAQQKGVKAQFEHQHLGVDHAHHYASMSIIDTAGQFMAPTLGEVGDRPFIISNPEYLGLPDKERAYKIMAEWAVLSLAIAWGGHSEIQNETNLEYQIVVAVSADSREADMELFNRYYQTAYDAKKAGFGQHKARVSFVTAQELSQSR